MSKDDGWYTTMTPMPEVTKLMLLSSLIERGHDEDKARAAVYEGEWRGLPVADDERRQLTCRYCKTPPYRCEQSGRLMIGCGGYCIMAEFGKMKEEADSLKETVRKNRMKSTQGEEESPLLGVFGEVAGKWG